MDAVEVLQAGRKVMICGLRTNTELNLQLGLVLDYDHRSERHKVRVYSSGRVVRVKRGNIQPVLQEMSAGLVPLEEV